MANSSTDSADGKHFSPGAIAVLRDALGSQMPGTLPTSGSQAENDEAIRAALAGLCDEAHALGLGPEAMVIALKSAWAHATRARTADREAVAAAYAQMLSLCIETYYRSRK